MSGRKALLLKNARKKRVQQIHHIVRADQVTCNLSTLFTRCAVQGDQLVVYGGERSAAAEPPDRAEPGEGGEDDEEDSEPIADVCQLCLQSHYWVVLPMEGEKNSQLPARTGPSITAMPDGRGLVFGESSTHLFKMHLLPLKLTTRRCSRTPGLSCLWVETGHPSCWPAPALTLLPCHAFKALCSISSYLVISPAVHEQLQPHAEQLTADTANAAWMDRVCIRMQMGWTHLMSSFSLMQSSALKTLPMRHGLTGDAFACRRPGLGGQIPQRRLHRGPALLQVVRPGRHHQECAPKAPRLPHVSPRCSSVLQRRKSAALGLIYDLCHLMVRSSLIFRPLLMQGDTGGRPHHCDGRPGVPPVVLQGGLSHASHIRQ